MNPVSLRAFCLFYCPFHLSGTNLAEMILIRVSHLLRMQEDILNANSDLIWPTDGAQRAQQSYVSSLFEDMLFLEAAADDQLFIICKFH